MDRKRVIFLWLMMASAIALVAYLVGASWWVAVLIGVGLVAAVVGCTTGLMYWKQKKLMTRVARFNIDLKNGKINPADLRRMYFSGGKARQDALYIASRGMNCSVQEAERQLSTKMSKQAAQQEMVKLQGKQNSKQKRYGKPR